METGATGSSIVVTGATGALGSAVVRGLVARGHRVAALSRRGGDARLGALEAELGGACIGIGADILTAAGWAEALARIHAEAGPPAGAALVAGGWTGGAPFHAEGGDALFRAMMEQNLETAQQSLRALLPGMVARGAGSVVVVGSRAAARPETSAGAAAYAASKAAVVALAQAVAAEVRAQGVRVNAVLPSTLDTEVNRRAMPDADHSAWVTLESLAGVIAFLLSDEARDITGAAIPVYGRT